MTRRARAILVIATLAALTTRRMQARLRAADGLAGLNLGRARARKALLSGFN